VCLGGGGVCGIGYQTLFWRHFQRTPEEEPGDGHIEVFKKTKRNGHIEVFKNEKEKEPENKKPEKM
jgi:hypothetical protein